MTPSGTLFHHLERERESEHTTRAKNTTVYHAHRTLVKAVGDPQVALDDGSHQAMLAANVHKLIQCDGGFTRAWPIATVGGAGGFPEHAHDVGGGAVWVDLANQLAKLVQAQAPEEGRGRGWRAWV